MSYPHEGRAWVLGNVHGKAVGPSLDRLTHIARNLKIHTNTALTRVSLGRATHVGGALFFGYNNTLCQSQVDAFLEALAAHGWTRDRSLGDYADR
jgi:hypothetical protein